MSCAGCENCPFDGSAKEIDPKNLPYELHITVAASSDIEKFKNDCAELGVKPILIDMQRKDGASMLDLMTSSTVKGHYATVLSKVSELVCEFANRGYSVLRAKIETVPWHPDANDMKEGQYFECHLAVKSPPTGRQRLERIAKSHGAHLSRNAFKTLQNDYSITMLTLRSKSFRDVFEQQVANLKKELERNDFDVDKTIIEFAIFDSKVDHDKAWIG